MASEEARVATPKPKKPRAPGWVDLGDHFGGRAYGHQSGLRAISSVDLPGGVPTFHVSASRAEGRPSDDDVRRLLAAFDMKDAEETDPEINARVRHFWRTVQ